MENELRHWGIKDMHWGIRRFRNRDGTLTPAGKERYSKTGMTKKPKASEMTDEQLKKAVDRMNLEKQYKNLMSELHPDKMKRVKKLMADLAETTVRKISEKAITAMVDRAFSSKHDVKTETENVDLTKISDKDLDKVVARLGKEESYQKLLDAKKKKSGS